MWLETRISRSGLFRATSHVLDQRMLFSLAVPLASSHTVPRGVCHGGSDEWWCVKPTLGIALELSRRARVYTGCSNV